VAYPSNFQGCNAVGLSVNFTQNVGIRRLLTGVVWVQVFSCTSASVDRACEMCTSVRIGRNNLHVKRSV
jgi:hypothetical protein